jgi:hypothetical protein
MKHTFPKLVLLTTAALGCSTLAVAQTIVFSETFDPAPETLTDFNMQLGGTIPAPTNTKILPLGQWGQTANGSFVDIGGENGMVAQPQLDAKENGRLMSIFLDPSWFSATGAGTYRLKFDVIAGSSPGAGRVYIGAGSGYDLSGTTDAKLNLPLSAAGFGVKKADGTIVWPALTGLNGATAQHLLTTSTEWILADETATGEFRDTPGAPFDVETSATLTFNFEYDGTSAVVIAFGGYNTDVKIDNISIATIGAGGDTWAGYDIIDGQFVDTGSFLGFLEISSAPWVYSYDFGGYLYLPEGNVSLSGAWGFIPR